MGMTSNKGVCVEAVSRLLSSVQPAVPVETSWTRHPFGRIGTLGFIRNSTVCGFDALRSMNRYKSLVLLIF